MAEGKVCFVFRELLPDRVDHNHIAFRRTMVKHDHIADLVAHYIDHTCNRAIEDRLLPVKDEVLVRITIDDHRRNGGDGT